jgi:hypothetical protein
MAGSFIDSACQIRQGEFKYFYVNGTLKSAGSFIDNKRQGRWFSFYDDRKLKDSSVYEKGKKTGTSLSWFPDKTLSDSSVWNSNGTATMTSWFSNRNISMTGQYFRYKKEGPWQYYHRNGKLSCREEYHEGKLVNKNYFDEGGVALADTANLDHQASFPGGKKAWSKFLSKQLYFPDGYIIQKTDEAVVVAEAEIDEEGNIVAVEVVSPLHPAMDAVAVQALMKSPKWTPAVEHNRRVKYKVTQTVYFEQLVD